MDVKGIHQSFEVRNLVFENASAFDLWLKLILFGVPALMFIGGLALIYSDLPGALTMFGTAAFVILLFKTVLPRRLQIFDDRLRIVLGGPLALSIPFSKIKSVRGASGSKALSSSSSGIHFATSLRYVVSISRAKNLSVTISPASGELFLEQLKRAMEIAARKGKAPTH